MHIRHLEIFRAIMETGSTLGAAELLMVSQPAVSNQLKQLEAQIGFLLFQRAHGRLQPTAEARALYEKSETIFSAFGAVQSLVDQLGRGESGRLNFVSSPSLGHSVIPVALATFRAKHPRVSVEFDTPSNERIISMINGEIVEFGLTITPLDHPTISSTVLDEAPIVCAMPIGHPLERQEVIKPSDLTGVDMISFPRSSAIGLIMSDVVRASGGYQSSHVEVRFVSTALRLVEAGSGVALIDGFTAGFANRKAVSIRRVATPRRIPLVLSQLKDRTVSIAAKNFLERHLLQAITATEESKPKPGRRTAEPWAAKHRQTALGRTRRRG